MTHIRAWDWQKIGIVALVVSPLLVLAVLVARYAINVPFWDQWELVPLIQKMQHGTLTFSDLFAQHNEHRIFFPRIIMLSLAAMTHWNTLYEVATNILLAAATFGLLVLLVWRTFTTATLQVVAVLGIAIMLFSPAQFENWLWGWQIQWFLNVLGMAVAVWAWGAWRAKPGWQFVVAAAGAVVATFSLASGFFVWLVCLPLLLPKKLRPWLLPWVVLGVACILAYYIGYQQPPSSSGLYAMTHVAELATYLVTYLSLPVSFQMKTAFWVGLAYIAGIVALAWIGWRTQRIMVFRPLLPWLAIGLYGVLSAFSTGVSRLALGVDQAYSSRYGTISCLIAIAVLVAGVVLWERSSAVWRKRLLVAGVVFGLLICANYAKGALQMRARHADWVATATCAHQAQSEQDPCLAAKVYPNAKVLWPRLEFLRGIHWGGL